MKVDEDSYWDRDISLVRMVDVELALENSHEVLELE